MTDGPAAAWSGIALACLLVGLLLHHGPLLAVGHFICRLGLLDS